MGKTNGTLSNSRWLFLLLLFLSIFLFLFLKEEETALDRNEEIGKKEARIPQDQCAAFCPARQDQLIKHHGGDLIDTNYLVKTVEKERDNFHKMLKENYGEESFKSMWIDKETNQVVGNRAIFSANMESDVSYKKLKRKLQLKALRVQIALMEDKKNIGGCDCTETSVSSSSRRGRRILNSEKTIVLPEVSDYFERFVWSTGGHSAAAAHGNLFNESYTSYLESSAKDAFRAIGIEFIGRNYAMGGMDSAPQLALCNEAVYGVDADVISWDFGMTDGQAHWKTNLYANRIGMHKNRPAHVSLNMAGRQLKGRVLELQKAESDGVPSLYLKPEIQDKITEGVPDVYGMKPDDVAKIGPFARYYKCKDTVEKEEPCGNMKWNDNVCPKRKFKTSWHPGWRVHASTGFLMASFMIETLIESLKELEGNYGSKTAREMYDELKAEEDSDYAAFSNTKVSDEYFNFVSEELVKEGLKTNIFFRNKAICKTALLPAQTRYLGILTESELKGEFKGFDKGMEMQNALKTPATEGKDNPSMALVYNKEEYQTCEVDLNVDHKNYFLASDQSGWASLKFPNDAEIAAYAPEKGEFNPDGVIVLCLYKCDWGKCPPGEFREEELKNGKLKLEINGNAVTDMIKIDQCFVLKTKDGLYHKPKKDNGRYELRVWLEKQIGETSFIRITSLIVL
eukprot:CAMPEP_0194137246 /NCGR_PEP_ID=MMETSP0152-20130528/7163_1 /TAXON_ID=1049557 /ORGANISM="Thalassiothrix antarctica, Strain L6-D1" /LENGTH=680 /DNA_ID=CAMNT_0038834201 /DNA_START=31 /DNA_END=2073 /DNA_ORIENTATION=+